MKTQTKVKAGSLTHNHNESQVRDAAPGLKVQTNVKARALDGYHPGTRRSVAMKWSDRALKSRRLWRMRVEVLEERQLLATITVNTAADDTTAGATLSLRQAIEVSDGTLAVSALSQQQQALVTGPVGAYNTIGFNIPTTDHGYNPATGAWTITLQSALPSISTNSAVINGYSQTGASENTLAQGDNARILIAIDGHQAVANGLTIAQQGSQVLGLDIENFVDDGVLVTAGFEVQVAGNFIGSDPTGETAAPNGTGVAIEGSDSGIGGPNLGDRNLISGNAGYGVFVPDQAGNPHNIEPTGNQISNNFIGIDATGSKALGNGLAGVYDSGSGDLYDTGAGGYGNVISGNKAGGLKSGGNISIENNFIGTDATGNVALGNGNSSFGGITADQGVGDAPVTYVNISQNVVSGNLTGGIAVSASSQPSGSNYVIFRNLVGTNSAGTAALGNGGTGLALESLENADVFNNVISANDVGLSLSGFGPDVENNVIYSNLIGTDQTGLVALGNATVGMILSNAIGNTVGGTAAGSGNVIAYNGGYGIELDGGQQNLITQNSIFGNAGEGIKLDSSASNNFATPPVITFTPGSGGIGTLAGTLTATANTTYDMEIYSNPSAPTAGQEQGKTFIAEVTLNTDGSGKGSFSLTEPLGFYTVTATDPNGNTSAFSNAVGTQPSTPASMTVVSSSLNPSTAGDQVTFTAVVTAAGFAGTPTGTVTFFIDGQAQTPVPLSVVGGMDQAQFATSTLTAGDHSVTAAYSGDTSVSPNGGSLPTQTVKPSNAVPSTTVVSTSLNPSPAGQQVTFTAVVTAPELDNVPSGTVTFTIDGQAQAPVPLSMVNDTGVAQFVTGALAVGQHSVTAAYSGETDEVSPSSGSLPTQTVSSASLAATQTAVSSSANPSTAGQPVTFTAAVTATGNQGTPTGTVIFTIDGQAQPPVPLSVVGGADLAQFVTSTLTRGQHSVVASYSGDSSFGASTVSTTLIQRVNSPGSTTTLASSANPSKVGDSMTFTATVTAGSGTFTPSGEVTFSIDGRTEPPVSVQLVNGHDQASFSISTLSAGQHSINATYDGGSMFAPSSVITPLTQTVDGTPVVGPPSVEIPSVALVQRFGIHNEPTVLVVTFTSALDSESAQDLENYVIVGPSGRHIGIDSAVYDASAHTVTLRPSKKINLHHDYQFTIIGTGSNGVAGVNHTLLDGASDGKPASNCVTTLNWKNVVLTPAQLKQLYAESHTAPAGPLAHRFGSRKH